MDLIADTNLIVDLERESRRSAPALAYDMPVVTNNRSEFERVPGLQVLAF